MNVDRIGRLLYREIRYGSVNFFLGFAIIMPILLSLLLTAVFGSLFSGTPELGIVDGGDNTVAAALVDLDYIDSTRYDSDDDLRDAVARGAVDMGVVFAADFDTQVAAGANVTVPAYIWGESQASHLAVLNAALLNTIFGDEGPTSAVEVNTVNLGDEEEIPLEDRLLPLIIMMAVVIGGTLIPSASLVDEKQKRTIKALNITPASLGEIYAAKALLGLIVSLGMGTLVLILNDAFGSEPGALVLTLALGATMASGFGILIGLFLNDMNSLFAVMKGLGIVLYAPALFNIFPDLPQWIAQFFPTYYITAPIMDISQNGADFGDILPDLGIMIAIIVVVIAIVLVLARRQQQFEV